MARPSSGSGSLALPTHLTWTYDFNTSAGAYAAPVGFVQGTGTLDLKWIPDAHPLAGTMGSGKVIVTFQGLINTSQLVSPVSKTDFVAAGREGMLGTARSRMRFRPRIGQMRRLGAGRTR